MRSLDDEPAAGALTLTANVEELAPSRAVRRDGCFALFFQGRDGVQVVELHPGQQRTIGRASPADIVVEDPSLSRAHARIETTTDGVWVLDLGSKNGTHVDGRSIDARVLVKAGSQLSLGNVSVLVRSARDAVQRGFEDFERFVTR